jgi:S-disulfanyl-L-cysteine oxidoreductase SoxD
VNEGPMRLREYLRRSVAITAGLCALVAPRLDAQTSAGAHRSTRAGVYSAEQATRGQDLYAGMCKSCHTAASHTGVAFQKSWEGRSLSELFGYISTKMPKNEPGSLAPEEYADLLAYLLKLNQMPVGATELPPDTSVLGTIRIDARAQSSRPHR